MCTKWVSEVNNFIGVRNVYVFVSIDIWSSVRTKEILSSGTGNPETFDVVGSCMEETSHRGPHAHGPLRAAFG